MTTTPCRRNPESEVPLKAKAMPAVDQSEPDTWYAKKGGEIVPSLAPVTASTSCNIAGNGTMHAATVTSGVMCSQLTMVPAPGTSSSAAVCVCCQVA